MSTKEARSDYVLLRTHAAARRRGCSPRAALAFKDRSKYGGSESALNRVGDPSGRVLVPIPTDSKIIKTIPIQIPIP